MYLKVLMGKINYKNNVYKTGELFECKKDIGLKLIKSKLCNEVPDDLFKAMSKNKQEPEKNEEIYEENNVTEKDTSNKTIDDLRDEL